MSLTTNNINQNELRKLAAREGYTFFGLTVPYLIMVTALIAIPVGWLFYLSFIGRDGTFSFENYERMWKSKAYIKIFITTFKISKGFDRWLQLIDDLQPYMEKYG